MVDAANSRIPAFTRDARGAIPGYRSARLPFDANHGLSRVIVSFFVAPPGTVPPWHTLSADLPFKRTWHVPQRPFLQSNLTRTPARLQTAPMGSPCLAFTTLLPFCGNVTSTSPFGTAACFLDANFSCRRAKSASRAETCPPPPPPLLPPPPNMPPNCMSGEAAGWTTGRASWHCNGAPGTSETASSGINAASAMVSTERAQGKAKAVEGWNFHVYSRPGKPPRVLPQS
mmetsp:Transcript_31931/g.78840  ORF Transcript_31931/g.78840 Transcript_31931/m.78840 type:complete len:229 (-) Transcript_31931:147-833(-)